jgi:hypothetical protein
MVLLEYRTEIIAYDLCCPRTHSDVSRPYHHNTKDGRRVNPRNPEEFVPDLYMGYRV